MPKNGTSQSFPISDDELERILALKRFEILDTEPEEAFERITRTVATIFEAPVVAVSLVDDNRQWFKSCYGLDVTETSRDVAFCAHTIMRDEIMIVNDATKDTRFQNNPLVTGEPAIRFYAGAPLRSAEGYRLGTLCVIDFQAREITEVQCKILEDMAALVVDAMELRLNRETVLDELKNRKEINTELASGMDQIQQIIDSMPSAVFAIDQDLNFRIVNKKLESWYDTAAPDLVGKPLAQYAEPTTFKTVLPYIKRALAGEETEVEIHTTHRDGKTRDVRIAYKPSFDAAGKIDGVYGITLDETERRSAEKARADSEALRRELVDGSVQGIFIHVDWKPVFANNALANQFGYDSPDEMLALGNIESWIAPHELPRMHKFSEDRLAGKKAPNAYEFQALRKDGTEFSVIHAARVIDWMGEKAVLSTLFDISEQKEAERALAEHVELLTRLHAETNRTDLGFADKIDRILELGIKTTGLPFGIVSEIEEDSYTVLNAIGFEDPLPTGSQFALGETYCVHTLNADGPTGFHHAGESDIADHPCYQAFGLESYLGAPVIVDGERFGTINFTDAAPQAQAFSSWHMTVIQLLATWIGAEVSRQKSNERRAESAAQFKSLVEGSVQGVFIHVDWRPVFANQALADILGYIDPDEVLALNSTEAFLMPHEVERVREYGRQRAAGESVPEMYEVQGRRKDGSAIPLIRMAKIIDWFGKPAVLGTVLDISERKVAEETLAEHVDLLTQLHTIANDPEQAFDEKVRNVLNLGVKAMGLPLGLVSQIEDDTLTVRYAGGHGDLPEAGTEFPLPETYCGLAFAAGEPTQFHHFSEGPKADHPCFGTFGFESYVGAPLIVDDQPYGTICFTSTEPQSEPFSDWQMSVIRLFAGWIGSEMSRQRAHERLAASEQRFKDFTETASDWVWESDAEHRMSYFSSRMDRLSGMGMQRVLGKRRWEFVGEEAIALDPEGWAAHREAVENHQSFRNFEYEARDLEGCRRRLNTSGKPLFSDDGTFLGYRGSSNEVTKLAEALEGLRAAKEEADAASAAKSQFLSSMSHELRTPLNSVLGFSQLLFKDSHNPLSDKQKGYIDRISDGGRHLLELIDEVLDMSKIEAGQYAYHREDVSPARVIGDCLATAEVLCDKYDVSLEPRDMSGAGHLINVDYTRVKQVLLNLISNGLKYNRQGGHAWVDCVPTSDGQLRLSVSDTGPGIPSDRQAELFQPFSRLGAEATSVEGTGIGLALSKRLIDDMGGRIGFDSIEGEGSTFWFEFPVIGVPADIRSDCVAASQAPTGEPDQAPDEARRNLLYVEDNPANQDLMREVLQSIDNLDLTIAHNAEIGLELAHAKLPDIIILDINLPGMDGYAALKILQAGATTQTIPVIALSADAMPNAINRGIAAGFREYLTKPLDVLRLQNLVGDLLAELPPLQ